MASVFWDGEGTLLVELLERDATKQFTATRAAGIKEVKQRT